MATRTLEQEYTLNEIEARQLYRTPIKRMQPTYAKHDYKLSKEERIKLARSILDSNK